LAISIFFSGDGTTVANEDNMPPKKDIIAVNDQG
jgi:hypothetical protein